MNFKGTAVSDLVNWVDLYLLHGAQHGAHRVGRAPRDDAQLLDVEHGGLSVLNFAVAALGAVARDERRELARLQSPRTSSVRA